MSLRKNRIACQGANNLSQIDLISNRTAPFMKASIKTFASSVNLRKTMAEDHNKSKYNSPDMKLTTENNWNGSIDGNKAGENVKINKPENFWTEKQTNKTPNLFCTKERKTQPADTMKTQKLEPALDKIRNLYKYNANVKKIIKAWGFESNGCISAQQFQQMISQHFDPSVTKEECQELIEKHSGQKQSLDLLSFMKIVFGEEPFTKPRINVLDPTIKSPSQSNDQLSKTLVNKIHQLNESNLLKEIDKNATLQKNLQFQIKGRSSENLHKMKSSFSSIALRTFEKTQPSLHQTLWSEANPKYTFFTTKQHGKQYLPTQFYGKNQQKTRFGATPPVPLNDQRFAENKRQKIVDEKMKVMRELQNERILQKMRYDNRIERIRQHRQKEKENVMVTDQKAAERDQANLKRIREENLAYNYVNFVHNDWK